MLFRSVVSSVAVVLPFVEIGFGLLLLAGVGTRLVAALSGLLLLIFIAGVAQAWARGLTIDCGCFGGGGQVAADQTAYGLELARDTGFLLLAGWLLIRPGSYLGVDRALSGVDRWPWMRPSRSEAWDESFPARQTG